MASVIEICNLALSEIRGGSINSLTESSLQAQQCKLHYPVVRDMVLRDANWNFAHKIAPLQLMSTTTIFGWAYVYAYPNDCLYINRLVLDISQVASPGTGVTRPRRIEDYLGAPDLRRQVKYEVFNVDGVRVIATNEPNLRIDYRSRVEDPNLFDPTFTLALSKLLAAEIAIPIVGSDAGRALRGDAVQMYRSYIASAGASNSNERYVEPVESDFITVRG